MFKKFIYRSVAGATAVGSVLAVSLIATPATVTSAPAIRNVAEDCNLQYPSSVATSTDLKLTRIAAQYGTQNVATVLVTRDDAGSRKPVGRVRVSIGNAWSRTVRLVDGQASVDLPHTLNAGNTYTVRARYIPPSCSMFAASRDLASYTVFRARVRLAVNAPNVARGVRPRVNVLATSRTGVTVPGSVRVTILRQAVVVGRKWAALDSDGRVRVFFPRKRPGYYNVEVFYPRKANFTRATGEDDFRVFR